MLIIKIKDCKVPVKGGVISSFGCRYFIFKYCVSSLWLLLFFVIVFRVIFVLFIFGGRLFINRNTCKVSYISSTAFLLFSSEIEICDNET